jgi:hypothetical protein
MVRVDAEHVTSKHDTDETFGCHFSPHHPNHNDPHVHTHNWVFLCRTRRNCAGKLQVPRDNGNSWVTPRTFSKEIEDQLGRSFHGLLDGGYDTLQLTATRLCG